MQILANHPSEEKVAEKLTNNLQWFRKEKAKTKYLASLSENLHLFLAWGQEIAYYQPDNAQYMVYLALVTSYLRVNGSFLLYYRYPKQKVLLAFPPAQIGTHKAYLQSDFNLSDEDATKVMYFLTHAGGWKEVQKMSGWRTSIEDVMKNTLEQDRREREELAAEEAENTEDDEEDNYFGDDDGDNF